MEPIFTFIGILLGGGILTFIQFLISRSDNKDEKENEVLKKLDENKGDIQETQKEIKSVWKFIKDMNNEINERELKRDAMSARNHILRFNDELIENKDHSHEYFLNILDDIRDYDEYCETHPNFPNGRTIQASENIKKTYNRLFEKMKFTEKKEEN